MSKIDTGKIAAKIRVRITRSWRGYPIGAIISPPGAMRQILLQAKDQLGNKVAELVEEPDAYISPGQVHEHFEMQNRVDEAEAATEVKRGPGRPRKGESK